MNTVTIGIKSKPKFDNTAEIAQHIIANPEDFEWLEAVDVIEGKREVTTITDAGEAIEFLLIWC